MKWGCQEKKIDISICCIVVLYVFRCFCMVLWIADAKKFSGKNQAVSVSQKHPVINIQRRCQLLGCLLADGTLALFHFGDMPLGYPGQP